MNNFNNSNNKVDDDFINNNNNNKYKTLSINSNEFEIENEKHPIQLIEDEDQNISNIKKEEENIYNLKNNLILNKNPNLLKIDEFIRILEKIPKKIFFHKLALNYLMKNNIDINNEELISLLKIGNSKTYQKIIKNILNLNLTNNDYEDENISFKD